MIRDLEAVVNAVKKRLETDYQEHRRKAKEMSERIHYDLCSEDSVIICPNKKKKQNSKKKKK
jgi:hypothetical protein